MRVVGGAEDRLGLARAIDSVNFGELQDREPAAVAVGKRDLLARLERARLVFCDSERDRNRPRHARGQAHRVARAHVIRLAHETFKRRESARSQHLQIGQVARAEPNRLEPLGVARNCGALRGGNA